MSRYTLLEPREDLGRNIPVSSFEGLAIHHPNTNREAVRTGNAAAVDSRGAFVNGELESTRREGSHTLVKKDIILLDPSGNANVSVPAPISGYAHYLNPNTFGGVRIYDKPFGTPGAELIGQVLHMDNRTFTKREGERIEYGEALGIQSGTGPKGRHHFGTHAHVEVEPAQFQRYINDLLQGRIQSNGAVSPSQPGASTPAPESGTLKDTLLMPREQGEGVKRLQEALNKAGIRDEAGQPLPTTGYYGDKTEAAVRKYQEQNGLKVDGQAGENTLKGLGIYPGQTQTTPQPNPQAPTPQPQSPGTQQPPASQGQATTDGTVSHGGKFTPEVRAYLDMIAWKETAGGLNRSSYNENNGVRGSTGHFTQADVEAGNGFPKTAGTDFNVGRYQFNRGDWGDAKKADPSIKGYSPEDQDKVAYWTMTQKRPGHNVVDDLNRGDIRAAIRDGGYEWASLPGAHAGEGKQVPKGYTVDQAADYYNQRLSHYRSLEQGQGQTQGQTPSQPGQTSPQSNASDSGSLKDTLLVKGEDGAGVKRLQEALNAAGVRVDGQPLPTTGHFGDQTEAAVKQYQEQKKLEVDGKAGKDTLTALGIYPGQTQATPTPNPQQPSQQTPDPQPSTQQPTQQAPTQPQQAPTQPQPTQQTPAQPQPAPQTPDQQPSSQQPTQQQTPAQPQAPQQAPNPQAPPTSSSEQPPTQQQPQQPPASSSDKPSIADPKHPDHKLYEQAMANLQQLGPSGGFKSQDELTKAAAAVAADARASGLNSIDHVAKTNTPNGQTLLVAVEGNPTNPASKNSYIDYGQATTQTVQQSTQMADATRTQQPATPQPEQQQENRMAVGAR
ncbi:MAG: peptidoglycan-binding protein [Lysobacteraceae bacterium]